MSRGFRFIQDMQIVCLCFFYDPVEKAAALAHSGWRGTVGRIGAKMVQFLENEYGSKKENIIAAIGPSICRSCYEVSEDVADEFKKRTDRT